MTLDEYQQAWRSGSAQSHVSVDTDLLLQQVQRNQQDFRSKVLRRDCGEIIVALLLLPVWVYMGIATASPWTWYLTMPALIWIAGFILVFRLRNKWNRIPSDQSLFECTESSLSDVENQIWLTRNVFWWYLLPPAIPLMVFTAHLTWLKTRNWKDALGDANAMVFFFIGALFYFIYYINQRAVTHELQPRRQELLTLLTNLSDESTAGEHVARTQARSDENSKKLKRGILTAAISCLAILGFFVLAGEEYNSSYSGPPQSSGSVGESLASILTQQRQEKRLVSLAAMVWVDGQVQAAAAHGERQNGSNVGVQIGDRWHLGGITKSITATMIASLIESGQMKWTDTVGQIFAGEQIHQAWQPVTLRQLLTDVAGAPRNFPTEVLRIRPPLGPESTQLRRKAVLSVLAKPPVYTPGEKYSYSNVGYTIAGAMAEEVTGSNWADLIKQKVFLPLELNEAGFGPPKSGDKTLEQPRGHRVVFGSKVSMDDAADNTLIMGPSGIAHMSLNNLCRYTNEHLLGNSGKGQLLSAETYKQLHSPELNDYYACGWVAKQPTYEIPHRLYWHNGSNTLWYALAVFIPSKNIVIAVTSNDGDWKQAEAAAWQIVNAMSQQFKVEEDIKARESLLDSSLPSLEFPKKSPFAAVRWQESLPEVKVDQQWHKLESLNDLSIAEILAFSQKTYPNKWQKRFEEDLVELLIRMGHPPQDTVKLVVRSLKSDTTQTLEAVPLTRENRRAIRNAAQARKAQKP